MDPLLQVVLLSLLPGAGNVAGGVVAEVWRPSARQLNLALHAASGLLVAIVAVELLPAARDVLAGWQMAAAFAAGGGAYVAIQMIVERSDRPAARTGHTRAWLIYAAVAVDLATDGLTLGAGSAVSASLGVALASGQILADIPEGYASAAAFRANGIPRRRRLWLLASFAAVCTAAATFAYFALRAAPRPLQAMALACAAGLLILAAVEDLLEEAHASDEDTTRSMLAFLAGFVVFTLVALGPAR